MTKEELSGYVSAQENISISGTLIEKGRNVVAFTAQGAKHFKSYGIREGSLLLFDLDKPFVPGHPSCFISLRNKTNPKLKMSKKAEPGFEHVGGFIAAFTKWAD